MWAFLLFRSSSPSFLISPKRLLTLISLTAIGGLIGLAAAAATAQPQSDAAATEAKQHYQNAVVAIGKSDWLTAKNELLQAEKLAPNNALVHYDLALAYSHTGQVKSAQAELDKSLQLGLPTEQKQAAEHLKQQLSNRVASAKTNGDTASGPKSGSHPTASAGPSIAETLNWIQQKVGSESVLVYSYDSPTFHADFDVKDRIEGIDGCHIVHVSEVFVTNKMAGGQPQRGNHTITRTLIDLSTLNSDVGVSQQPIDNNLPEKKWVVVITVAQGHLVEHTIDDDHEYDNTRYNAIAIGFPQADQDIATRVGKAMGDAITKCKAQAPREPY